MIRFTVKVGLRPPFLSARLLTLPSLGRQAWGDRFRDDRFKINGGELRLDSRLQEIVEKVTAREGLELVHAELSGGRRPTLKVLIDKPGGVTIDDCATVSEKLGMTLDVEDVIPSQYMLEVASPGLDRGLYREADYERFAGLPAHIRTIEPIAGQRNFHGRLVGLDRTGELAAVLEEPTGVRHLIPLALITKAWVEIEPQQIHPVDRDE